MHLLLNHITRRSNRIRVTDTGVKFLTCNKIVRIGTEDTVDTVMSLVTNHCMMIMNHLPRAIRFKYRRYHINICIILLIIIIIVKIILLLLLLILLLKLDCYCYC
ncbi:hypothetical protein HanXRQr2_Chr04g0143551 [Helianthus annuus]|uniref:Uncharacterized protein n=1 Tax=Helianthus annuus TaxID=4232 RepID=A0A9K3J4J4_HELAN|nr:hypothetical protein HanXRQr2_Chr04g0143551 [Helianthus annuus]